MNGFVLIDKPIGPTSFDMVKKIKHIYQEKRVGHAGTLDPLASGLLVIALGNATRLLPFLPDEPKAYTFTVYFGKSTTTFDAEGEITDTGGTMPSLLELTSAIQGLTGEIEQTPPHFSAIKVNGKRAYDLARAGADFSLESRTITIHTLSVESIEQSCQSAQFKVTCSSGTYVRSLAVSIAEACDTIGHVTKLRRTAIGIFDVASALSFDSLMADTPAEPLSAFSIFGSRNAFFPSVCEIQDLMHGRSIAHSACITVDISTKNSSVGSHFFAFDTRKNLLAVLKQSSDETSRLQPIRVFQNQPTQAVS